MLGISTAAATVVVDRLTKVGHVTRAPHPTDRRGIDLVIHDFDESQQEAITEYLRRVVTVYRDSMPSAGNE